MQMRNPERASRGGDVAGQTRTDVEGAVGSPITVADASYEPGYSMETTLDAGYVSMADLKQGFCSYGECVGETRIPGIIGGRK
jgi:hypothetical protein